MEPAQSPAQQAKLLTDALLALAENAVHIAVAKRRLYDAYVSEGFTEAQALELVKTMGL